MEFFKGITVNFDAFFGGDFTVGDVAEGIDKRARIFRAFDPAAEEGDTCAALLCVGNQLIRIVGRAGYAAKDSDNEVCVVGDEGLHEFGSVICDFQEFRSGGARYAGKHSGDLIDDEVAYALRRDATVGNIGVEDFKKIAEVVLNGFDPELLELFERIPVGVQVVVEGDRIETQIDVRCLIGFGCERAVLGFLYRGGREGSGRMFLVAAAARSPEICRVICAYGRRDR